MTPPPTLRVGYVLEPLARSAESILYDELRVLEGEGARVTIFVVASPDDPARPPLAAGSRIAIEQVPSVRRGRPLQPATDRPCSRAGWLARRGTELGIEHWHAPSAGTAVLTRRVHELSGVPFSFALRLADLCCDDVGLGRLRTAIVVSAFTLTPTTTVSAHAAQVLGPSVARKLRCFRRGIDLGPLAFNGAMGRLDDAVLAIGPLEEAEGFLDLIDAVTMLRDRGQLTRLTLVGSGSQEGVILARIQERRLGSLVTLTGALSRDDILGLMRRHTLLAVPRASDAGCPDGAVEDRVAEAMACGLPVVATDVDGMTELVHDGVNGRVIGARQPLWLAGAIETLLHAPAMRARFAMAARREAEARLDLVRNVAVLHDWFASARAGRAASAQPERVAGRAMRSLTMEIGI